MLVVSDGAQRERGLLPRMFELYRITQHHLIQLLYVGLFTDTSASVTSAVPRLSPEKRPPLSVKLTKLYKPYRLVAFWPIGSKAAYPSLKLRSVSTKCSTPTKGDDVFDQHYLLHTAVLKSPSGSFTAITQSASAPRTNTSDCHTWSHAGSLKLYCGYKWYKGISFG